MLSQLERCCDNAATRALRRKQHEWVPKARRRSLAHIPALLQDGMVDMTEEDKDEQESSLYKEDSFRMYCMKVSSRTSRQLILASLVGFCGPFDITLDHSAASSLRKYMLSGLPSCLT